MNRFKNYLESQRLAKHWLLSAEEREKGGDLAGAIEFLVKAIREFQVCTNCIASLYFQRRKKK